MRARILFVFSLLVAGAVSACGGGGGGGGNPPPTTQPTSTATATTGPAVSANPNGCVGVNTATRGSGARPAAVGVQPPGAGDSATYAGTYSEVIDRSSPCPVGTASSTANVTIDVSMSSANQETDSETDAFATETTTNTTVATIATATPNSTVVYTESTENSTDTLGDVLTTTYGLSPLVYAVESPFPYTLGAIDNDPPSEVKDVLVDGSSTDRTYAAAADGSYTENDVLTGVPADVITANTDFSASYLINTPSGSVPSVTFSFSKPVSGTITLSISPAGLATPIPIPQWWPTTATKLYTDVTNDIGSKSLPAQCSPSGLSTGEDFERVITSIDPALGATDTRTIDTYVGATGYGALATPAGPACVVISDVQKLFYDYLYDTPYLFYNTQDGLPFQTDTINESYWLTSSPSTLTRVRSDAVSPANVPGLIASVAAHNAGLNFVRATQRMQRLTAYATSLRKMTKLKGAIIK